MRIDTHQHYWHYHPRELSWISAEMDVLRRDRLPQDSRPAMAASGISHAIAVQARSLPAETGFLLALAQHDPAIAGVVGWTDLRAPGLAGQLAAWAGHAKLRGFRHLLQDEDDLAGMLADATFGKGVALLQAQGLVYDVLVRGAGQLAAAHAFCARHDRHWLVLDHLGKPALQAWDTAHSQAWLAALRELATLPHVACKLSGLVTETGWSARPRLPGADVGKLFDCLDAALDAFGPRRILFGSDWPVCELAAPYQTVAALTQAWASSRLDADQQADFWAGNAVRCYGLAI